MLVIAGHFEYFHSADRNLLPPKREIILRSLRPVNRPEKQNVSGIRDDFTVRDGSASR